MDITYQIKMITRFEDDDLSIVRSQSNFHHLGLTFIGWSTQRYNSELFDIINIQYRIYEQYTQEYYVLMHKPYFHKFSILVRKYQNSPKEWTDYYHC